MKKVLLSSTALVFAAGVASAEMSMSGSAELVYGNFGTGSKPGASSAAYSAGADVDIAMSGGNGDVSYSVTLELDEGATAMGPLSFSMGGLSVVYDKNDLSDLTVATADYDANTNASGDGEDDNVGDLKITYSMGALTASVATDEDTSDSVTVLSYAADGMSASVEMTDQAGTQTTEFAVSYATGGMTIGANADDADDWDVSVGYDLGGGTSVTVATGADEVSKITAATTVGAIALSIGQEFGEDDETELSASYSAGGISFAITSDSGQAGHYGDEAETVLSFGYDLGGGAALAAKANDQDEVEVKVSFSF
jgi:outer membrane protein OmpU